MNSVVWLLILWHFKEIDTVKIQDLFSTKDKYSATISHVIHTEITWLIVSHQWVTEVSISNSAPCCFQFRAPLFQIPCPAVSNSAPRCFKFHALLFPIPCPAVSNSMPCCFKLRAPLFQILCPADVSHSIINLEQACVLTELTHSKSYLMWDKQSYILTSYYTADGYVTTTS